MARNGVSSTPSIVLLTTFGVRTMPRYHLYLTFLKEVVVLVDEKYVSRSVNATLKTR